MISEERRKFLYSLRLPTLFFVLMLLVEIIGEIFHISFVQFGIFPRRLAGTVGILTAPFIHSGFTHLFSNVFPLLLLGSGIGYFYPESSKKMFPLLYFSTNILVWFFARESYHIGASGIVYGLASFLFFSGVFRKDRRASTLSLLTIFLYSGLIIGLFPNKEGISWESHLFGFLTGIVMAVIFRKKDPYKKYDWEDEELDVDVRNLKISYKNENPFNEGD